MAWEIKVSDGTGAVCHVSSSSFLLWSARVPEAVALPVHSVRGLGASVGTEVGWH